jgi:hypothetical protein
MNAEVAVMTETPLLDANYLSYNTSHEKFVSSWHMSGNSLLFEPML